MYLKKILLENVGPIDLLDISLPFKEKSRPKPVIFVGENGSGKSILLSYIVNALLIMQQELFAENSEIEKGKVYKYNNPNYIKVDSTYSFGKIEFENKLTYTELQLNCIREEFIRKNKIPHEDFFSLVQRNEDGHMELRFKEPFREKKQELETIYNKNCILYFPPNRFEEPAWLNLNNLHSKAKFSDFKQLKGFLNRKIINYSPLHDNLNWLFDIMYDLKVFGPIDYDDEDKNIYSSILTLFRIIFQKEGRLILGLGKRTNRKVSLILDEETLVSNIFQLSTGETALLNLFLTILRDYDLSFSSSPDLYSFKNLNEIRGLVLIDEIDIHLHSLHQRNILPKLISLFPQVQFVVTSHSPLFILGLEEKLGSDGISIIQLPEGKEISSEQFSEFEKAFSAFEDTKKYEEKIRAEIEKSHKPILFVEGDYDIRYLKKAAELHGKTDFLNSLLLKDSDGFGNINNVLRHFDSKLAEITPQKIILLYDCDISKKCKDKVNIYCRVMQTIESNPIKKGIENLFSQETLNKARAKKHAFIDTIEEHTETVRGEEKHIPKSWSVNKDEKGNLCNWLCENGTSDDFNNFTLVFELIEKILASD